jgi:hypothetical protein
MAQDERRGFEIVEDFPFMLRLSKHSEPLFSTLLEYLTARPWVHAKGRAIILRNRQAVSPKSGGATGVRYRSLGFGSFEPPRPAA